MPNHSVVTLALALSHCEAIAGGIMNFIHIPGVTNYVDVLNKPLSNDAFHGLIMPLLFRVPKAGREIED
jgi:hypothetical protein